MAPKQRSLSNVAPSLRRNGARLQPRAEKPRTALEERFIASPVRVLLRDAPLAPRRRLDPPNDPKVTTNF